MTLPPDDNRRLLHNAELMLKAKYLSRAELRFVIGVQGRTKQKPGRMLTDREAPWLSRIVARFLRETLGGAADEGQGT